MRMPKVLVHKLMDKALKPYDKTFEQVEKEDADCLAGEKKKKKDCLPYYLRYPFQSEEHYNDWVKFAKPLVEKSYPGADGEIEFSMFEMLYGLGEAFRFEKKEQKTDENEKAP